MKNTKETLASNCYNQIKELILSGELQADDRIKGDYLKNLLQVGLSPIREALSRLIHSGLVELVDNSGFKVATISHKKIQDFYKAYAEIEQLLFVDSIKNHAKEWESGIIATLYQLAKIENSSNNVMYSDWASVNDEFHSALINGSDNIELKNILEQLNTRKTWYHNLAYGINNHKLIRVNHREHSKIAGLALNQDIDSASKLLYNHTMQGFELVMSNLSKQTIRLF